MYHCSKSEQRFDDSTSRWCVSGAAEQADIFGQITLPVQLSADGLRSCFLIRELKCRSLPSSGIRGAGETNRFGAWKALLKCNPPQADWLQYSLNARVQVRFLSDSFGVAPINNLWRGRIVHGKIAEAKRLRSPNCNQRLMCSAVVLMTTDPGDLGARSHLWLWYHCVRFRTMGPPLDHHRHFPSSAGARPCPGHGRALPVLPPRRQSGRAAQGSRDHAQGSIGDVDARRRPAGIRLRAGAAHHAQVDRQQRRDRRHLGALAGDAGAAARRPERQARWRLGGVAGSPRGVRGLAGGAVETHRLWWEARIARQQEIDASIAAPSRLRVPLRQALRGQPEGPGGGTVHGGEPLAAPRASRRRGRRAHRPRGRAEGRLRAAAGLRGDDPGAARDRRRAAGAQGGWHRLRRRHALAGCVHLRGGTLPRRQWRCRPGEARRDLRWPGVRHGVPSGPGGGRARGGRRRLRRPDRLRVQLRGALRPSSTALAASRC